MMSWIVPRGVKCGSPGALHLISIVSSHPHGGVICEQAGFSITQSDVVIASYTGSHVKPSLTTFCHHYFDMNCMQNLLNQHLQEFSFSLFNVDVKSYRPSPVAAFDNITPSVVEVVNEWAYHTPP